MSQRDDFVSFQLSVVGYNYGQGGSRCTGASHYFDCSGLQSWAGNKVGLNYECSNSSSFATDCHNAVRPQWMIDMFGPGRGTGITQAQANATKGAWAFHGSDEGMQGFGNSGHIKCSLGDGRSVEAYDTAEGVIIGRFLDPKVSYCALPIGLQGFNQLAGPNPGPSSAWEAQNMGMIARLIPGAHTQTRGPLTGRMPFVAAINNADTTLDIVGYNGAHLPPTINAQGKAVNPINGVGLSVLHMGHINQPVAAADFIVDKDGNVTGQVVFLAGDGGTFGPIKPTVVYA